MKGIFHWLKDSSKMKRWIMLILVGVVFASFGMAEMITSSNSITFGYAAKIIVYFVIGFTCVVLGIVFLNKRTMELFVEATDDRIEGKNKVNVNSLIFNKTVYNQGPKIVVIGGGSGLTNTLEGLKKYTNNITALVTVSDYGESFNKKGKTMLYKQFEDIKNSFSALMETENSKMTELLDYKFTEKGLKDLKFSDVYFSAMKEISGNMVEAINDSNDIFKVCGKILPITKDEMKICAELDNGYMIEDKSQIAKAVYDNITKINRVYLNPINCKPIPEVLEEIKNADGIIIAPGSLYANVIPNLLVKGVARALKESKAVKLYVCNIMTEPGLTDDYSVADHVNAIIDHCGEGVFNYCLYDTGEIVPEFIKRYSLKGSMPVFQELTKVKDKNIKFMQDNVSVVKDGLIRHNSTKIADTIIKIICDDLKYQDKHNDIEYMMMNSKLQIDKEIEREKRRKEKLDKKKKGSKESETKLKSKFSNKYKDRIKSIKEADEKKHKKTQK